MKTPGLRNLLRGSSSMKKNTQRVKIKGDQDRRAVLSRKSHRGNGKKLGGKLKGQKSLPSLLFSIPIGVKAKCTQRNDVLGRASSPRGIKSMREGEKKT